MNMIPLMKHVPHNPIPQPVRAYIRPLCISSGVGEHYPGPTFRVDIDVLLQLADIYSSCMHDSV